MPETTCLEKTKNDASEIAELLKEIPENKKESILMLVKGFKLGIESEELERAAGQGGGGVDGKKEFYTDVKWLKKPINMQKEGEVDLP